MRVLLVSSGKKGKVSELIRNQGDSLIKAGVDVDYFILKSGFTGYFSGIFEIRKSYKKGRFDLIHAHYSYSAFASSLAGNFPVLASLMGSDAYKPVLVKLLTRFFYLFRWKKTIVKTSNMQSILRMNKSEVVPNGVDINRFMPIPKNVARTKIGFSLTRKLIVFVSDPSRREKNYKLALLAVKALNMDDLEIMPVYNLPNNEIPYYLNAADVLLLTSIREGSVNVVKEAMACNVPVVSTDVGDVKENAKDLPGCFICDSNPESLANGLRKAISLPYSTSSRDRILELRFDSETIAKRIISIYNDVISNGN